MAGGSFWTVTLSLMFLGATTVFFMAFFYPDWVHNDDIAAGLWNQACDLNKKACKELQCYETPYDKDWCWFWAAALMCLGLVCCVISVFAFSFWLHITMTGQQKEIHRESRYVAQLSFLFTAGFDMFAILTLNIGIGISLNGYGFYFAVANLLLNLGLFLLLLLTGPHFAID